MSGRRKEMEDKRVLILEDNPCDMRLTADILRQAGYEVAEAPDITKGNQLVADSLINGRPFNLSLVDLYVGNDSGAEFARRLMEIIGDVNVVIMTGHPYPAAELPFQPDGIIIKSFFNDHTIIETVNRLMQPKRHSSGADDVRLNHWLATESFVGFNDLTYFSSQCSGQEGDDTEKVYGITSFEEGQWVNCVVYYQPEVDETAIYLGLSSMIGCGCECEFCIQWRNRRDEFGNVIKMVRRFKSGEIMGQAYLLLNRPKVRQIFAANSGKRLVYNFTCGGDALVYNLTNTCIAIPQLLQTRPGTSVIITSIGAYEPLKQYLQKYTDYPWAKQVIHYRSVNSGFEEIRAKLMPGTLGHSLELIRDWDEKIAEKTGNPLTVSIIVIKGVTDRPEDAKRIVSLYNGYMVKVKLMALVDGSLKGAEAVTDADVERFKKRLEDEGAQFPIRIRKIRGVDIYSGCGNTTTEWDILNQLERQRISSKAARRS